MWGTRSPVDRDRHNTRFIPAYVGNTRRRRFPGECPPVHPRVCGEHPVPGSTSGRRGGSSPRMWGTQVRLEQVMHGLRFIPAYVGNTCERISREPTITVHPRVCGEHLDLGNLKSNEDGSSPRMWGTPNQAIAERMRSRFIPAYVGNTFPCGLLHHGSSVHPRVCGEHDSPRGPFTRIAGSSPRMWGTLNRLDLAELAGRFIPAYVGNTLGRERILRLHTVHPRVCGEHQEIP